MIACIVKIPDGGIAADRSASYPWIAQQTEEIESFPKVGEWMSGVICVLI